MARSSTIKNERNHPATKRQKQDTILESFRSQEHGILHRFKARQFGLIFDSEPFWVLGLHPQMVESVCILNNAANLNELTRFINTFPTRAKLYDKAFTRIGLSKIKFCSDWTTLPQECLILLSGSPVFYNSTCASSFFDNVVVYIANDHYTKRRLPGPLPLQRIHHHSVGGASTFIAIGGYHNTTARPMTSQLRRAIRHFLDYSLPPAPYDPALPPAFALSSNSQLPVHDVQIPVHYPSSFSRTGFGIRPLQSCELGNLFGLDSLMHNYVTPASFPFPPIQILHAMLRPILCP